MVLGVLTLKLPQKKLIPNILYYIIIMHVYISYDKLFI